MTCREFADFMDDYLSGELSEPVHEAFDHHLARCVNCRKYLNGYAQTISLEKAAFEQEDAALPPSVPEELVKAILAARTGA